MVLQQKVSKFLDVVGAKCNLAQQTGWRLPLDSFQFDRAEPFLSHTEGDWGPLAPVAGCFGVIRRRNGMQRQRIKTPSLFHISYQDSDVGYAQDARTLGLIAYGHSGAAEKNYKSQSQTFHEFTSGIRR